MGLDLFAKRYRGKYHSSYSAFDRLILADIRVEQKLRQSEDNDELDRELLRIVNGR